MSSGQFIQWYDFFAIVDDGSIALDRYDVIESVMVEQAKLFPRGLACLVILPPDAKPPPDDIKQTVKDVFVRLAPSISCLAYVIEGAGFKAVAARAALISMKIFLSRPYPIYVETSMREALTRMLPHLEKGKTVTTDVKVIMKAIADARANTTVSSLTPPTSTSRSPSRIGDVTSK